MADQKYIVVTPLRQHGEKKGEKVKIQPGKQVSLSDEDAEPLLKCGAIRKPDAPEEEPKAATKK
jgi:hypothetical protein